MDLIDCLTERGLIAQTTAPDLRERLAAAPTSAYCGFDPTADSLHVGSLVPIMGLRWLQRCGHRPVVLVGGATALVGDPSGKTEARKMLSREDVRRNANAIAAQIGRLVRFGDGPTDAVLVDNADWLAGLGWIDLLREAGPHFSVNRMLTMDSVKGRMESGGITFLEFNYMVMQAWDFMHLHRAQGCTLQLGGQDQWGNIVMGIELARRKDGAELFGLTLPLVTKSDGRKFGKTEAGNIWLDPARTGVYDFFQFWRNTADADVRRFLCFFTDLPMAEIDALTRDGGAAINAAKERLAVEVTTLLHGRAAAETALASAKAAFGAAHDAGGAAVPHADLPAAELAAGIAVLDLVVRAGLAASRGEAKRLIEGGGLQVGSAKVADPRRMVGAADADGPRLVLTAGKKRIFRFDVTQ